MKVSFKSWEGTHLGCGHPARIDQSHPTDAIGVHPCPTCGKESHVRIMRVSK